MPTSDTNRSNDLLPTIDVLSYLQSKGYLQSTIITPLTPFGPLSADAAQKYLTRNLSNPASLNWTPDRLRTAVEQIIIQERTGYDLGPIDGLIGPRTTYALELYQSKDRDITLPESHVTQPTIIKTGSPPTTAIPIKFPRQANVRSYFGEPGTPNCRAICDNLAFPLRMDGSYSKTAKLKLGQPGAPAPITRVACHVKLHDAFRSILNDILQSYGEEQIHALGLNQFAGSYNYRPMRGGSNLSMHAWGIAFDFDAQRNTLRETAATARFARPEYKRFIDIWYEHGFISLGRERNMDWMHLQAASL